MYFAKKLIWVYFINAKFDADFESVEKLLKCTHKKFICFFAHSIKSQKRHFSITFLLITFLHELLCNFLQIQNKLQIPHF
jgi:hypothetical protein